MPLKILVTDDHGVIRAGLRALLMNTAEIQVVGEAADGSEAIRLTETLRPDIVIMDLSMTEMGGIEATRRIKETNPDVRILILTIHEDDSLLKEALRAGASGYIIKRAVESDLINAIHVLARGDMYIHPSMTRALLRDIAPTPAPDVDIEALTPREVEVLRMLARGYTNRQIAEQLGISPRTVEGHRANISSKLGLHSRVDLVNYAEERGLLNPKK